MRKLVFGTLLMVFVTGWYSCSKDKGQIVQSKVVCDSTKVTYRGAIRQIMDDNCNSRGCHDGHSQSPDLTNYTGVVGSGDKVVCRVQGSSCGAQMPSGSPLDDTTIAKIVQWKAGGYCDTISQ